MIIKDRIQEVIVHLALEIIVVVVVIVIVIVIVIVVVVVVVVVGVLGVIFGNKVRVNNHKQKKMKWNKIEISKRKNNRCILNFKKGNLIKKWILKTVGNMLKIVNKHFLIKIFLNIENKLITLFMILQLIMEQKILKMVASILDNF